MLQATSNKRLGRKILKVERAITVNGSQQPIFAIVNPAIALAAHSLNAECLLKREHLISSLSLYFLVMSNPTNKKLV